jgi:hypothetical protein
MEANSPRPDLEVLELGLLDAATRAHLSQEVEVVRSRRGVDVKACERTGEGRVSREPWYDVTLGIGPCCELALGEDEDRLLSNAVAFVTIASVNFVVRSAEIHELRSELVSAVSYAPELKALLPKALAHLDALEAEHAAWLTKEGTEVLELAASWAWARRNGRDVGSAYPRLGGRALPVRQLGTEHEALVEVHRNRPRAEADVLVRTRGERHVLSRAALVSSPGLTDALERHRSGPRTWVLPGSLVPLVEGRDDELEVVSLDGADDAVRESLLVLVEESSMTLSKALEVARAL